MTQKYSRQREAIKSYLCSTDLHPTADMVYMHIRRECPKISLGTVYRNLSFLTRTGEIQKFSDLQGVEHFDACTSVHPHFICRSCGRILDLPPLPTERLCEEASLRFRGQIDDYSLFFHGICEDCLSEQGPDTIQER